MDRSKQVFSVGLLIGIVLTSLFCLVFAPRYTVNATADHPVKLDKWTGETWQLYKGNWKKIEKVEYDWKAIDKALYSALNLKGGNDDSEAGTAGLLQLLKSKYPVLEEVPNEEILERINIVYSKAILTDLYLKNVKKIHDTRETP